MKSYVFVTTFDKSLFNLFITNLIAGDISCNTGHSKTLEITPYHCSTKFFKIAVRFYVSGSFLQVIGGSFSVDKSTVSRVITNVYLCPDCETASLYLVAFDK